MRSILENVSPTLFWPEWMEKFRVQDELCAQAYETFPPACRAAIKTGIALTHFHYGEMSAIENAATIGAHSGFNRQRANFPYKWAVIIFDADFHEPARLCSACLLPALAGVRLVGAVCMDGQPAPQVLLTLELCGIEDVFVLDIKKTRALVEAMGSAGAGGLLTFKRLQEMDEVSACARKFSVPISDQSGQPRILVLENAGFDAVSMDFCLGPMLTCGDDSPLPVEAVYASANDARDMMRNSPGRPCFPRMYITPGCEGLWILKNIGPGFFRSEILAFELG